MKDLAQSKDKNNFVNIEEIIEQAKINGSENTEENTAIEQEIGLLNKNISEYEGQISNLFLVIGKTYYNLYKDDSEGFPQVIEVTSLYNKIEETKKRIDELKGIVKCPNCDAEVDKDARFCCNCGHKIITIIDNEHCSGCGAAINLDSIYCSNCGMKVERESNIVDDSHFELEKQEKRCRSCNTILADDDMFCPECGTKVSV